MSDLTAKYYKDYDECPLHVYRNVIMKNDVSYLCYEGECDNELAHEYFLKIRDQEVENTRTNKQDVVLELDKQIKESEYKYIVIQNALVGIALICQQNLKNEAYKVMYAEHGVELDFVELDVTPFVEQINRYRYNFDLGKPIDKEYNRVLNQSKNIENKIKRIKDQKENYLNETKGWNFDDSIVMVENHRGFPFTKNETVAKYVAVLNSLIRKKDGESNRSK